MSFREDFREEQKIELQRKENQLLRTTFMGDIREDVTFLGLTLTDMIWIIVNTVIFGFLIIFMFPSSIWVKAIWITLVFMFNLIGRVRKWPYRRKRYIRYLRQKKLGDGASYADFLGVEEDSWIYRNKQNKQVHLVTSVTALPWQTALYSQKEARIRSFELFLRSLVLEGFTATISSETVPDFRHEYWERKRNEDAVTEGIKELRQMRIDMWEDLANKGKAMRSEYTMTLSINERQIESIQQDEEEELTTEERKRYRFMSALREKKERTLSSLESSGHTTTVLSGFSVPEILSRWLDKQAWEEWKVSGDGWEEENDLEESQQQQHEAAADTADKEEKAVAGLRAIQQRFLQNISKDNAAAKEETASDDIGIVEKEIFHEEDPMTQANEDHSEEPDSVVSQALDAIQVKGGQNSQKPVKRILDAIKSINWLSVMHKFKIPRKKVKSSDQAFEEINDDQTFNSEESFESVLNVEKAKIKIFDWLHGIPSIVKKRTKVNPKNSDDINKQDMELLENIAVVKEERKLSLKDIDNKVYVLTSGSSTGKTFLGGNLSVTLSLSGKHTTLVDLSPDHGSLTVLNPQLVDSKAGDKEWALWNSRQVPDLDILVPSKYPRVEEIISCVEEYRKNGVVILDLPWDYPDRDQLAAEYGLVAVLDCDYHHWLKFESENNTWDGELWLNQTDDVMTKYMSQLVKDRYSMEFQAKFSYYAQANKYLYQGRPLALDPELRSIFYDQIIEVNKKVC